MVEDGRKFCILLILLVVIPFFELIVDFKVLTIVEVKCEVNAVFQQFDVGDFLPLRE